MDTGLRRQLESGVVLAMENAGRNVMVWGKDDCALWCAGIVQGVFGWDAAAEYRGKYRTRHGARRVLGKGGLDSALKRIARRHRLRRVDPAMALPGDLGLAWTTLDVPGRVPVPVLAMVICRASGWFVGRNEAGFTGLRASHVLKAWSLLGDNIQGARVAPRRIMSRPQFVPSAAIAAEPISTAIGLTALFTGLGASVAVAGAIGGFIVTTALSVGVSLVSSLMQPHVGQGPLSDSIADTSANAAVQVTERQPLPFKRAIVGSAFVGGALFFEQVKPPYLTMGTLVNYGLISGVDKIFIGTNGIFFSGGIVPNTVLTPTAVSGQPDYPNRLRVCVRLGAATQAVDPLILARYPSVGSEFRQRGIATFVAEYHFGGTDNSAASQAAFLALWGQNARPNAYIVARGVPVYDPRDPTQSLTDESTWRYSNNATLIQTWYLTRSWGGRIPTAKIRWDKIAESANYDDEVMACADGTKIKRHTIDGVITLNQRPFEVMQKLLASNRGRVLESAGQVWVASSQPKVAIATIHDAILASGIKYQSAKAKRDLVNKLQVRLVAPDQDYQLADGPILNRTDLQAIDGEVLPATLALEYTQDHRRAQRLQKAFLESARLGRTITCTVDTRLLAIVPDEIIDSVFTFNCPIFSVANGTYLCTAVGFSDDCTTLSLALTEYDPTIETDWNASVDEQPFTLATVNVS